MFHLKIQCSYLFIRSVSWSVIKLYFAVCLFVIMRAIFTRLFVITTNKTDNVIYDFVLRLIVIGEWGPYSRCSKSCGTGNQHRTRSCTGDCQHVLTYQDRACNTNMCTGGHFANCCANYSATAQLQKVKMHKCEITNAHCAAVQVTFIL